MDIHKSRLDHCADQQASASLALGEALLTTQTDQRIACSDEQPKAGQVVAGELRHVEPLVAEPFWLRGAGAVSPSCSAESELPAGASVGGSPLAAPGDSDVSPSREKAVPYESATLPHTGLTSAAPVDPDELGGPWSYAGGDDVFANHAL